tara:strand:- start:173 stop:925 length:753 start_codon:yes stop_codon:yes gene_type:complete
MDPVANNLPTRSAGVAAGLPQLSEENKEFDTLNDLNNYLNQLKDTPVSPTNHLHQNYLKTLLDAVQLAPGGDNKVGYIDCGFQLEEDPASDFRGSGLLGLRLLRLLTYFVVYNRDVVHKMLVHYARTRKHNAPNPWVDVMEENLDRRFTRWREDQDKCVGFPLAIVGINIVNFLLEQVNILAITWQAQPRAVRVGKRYMMMGVHRVFANMMQQFRFFWIKEAPKNIMTSQGVIVQFRKKLESDNYFSKWF